MTSPAHSHSSSLSEVQLKIQSLILLRFNRSGIAVALLEREYFSYFNEKLGVESLGFSSVLELLQSMKEQVVVQIQKTWTRPWTCRDGIPTVWALELSDVTCRDTLAKLFVTEKSRVKIQVSRSCAGAGVNPHKNPMDKDKMSSTEGKGNPPNSKISLNELPETNCGFSKEIEINRGNLKNILGKGGFGKVWRGNWNGMEVAVKIFPENDDKMKEMWKRETGIYNNMTAPSDRCVGFLGSATVSDIQMEHWIVMRYFDEGSLAHFLTNNTISLSTLVKLVYSLVNGLGFLHLDLQNDQIRNGIAHCDIKPENILVNRNMTCVYADFGHSCLKYTASENEKIDGIQKPGTIRYMAPEILNDRRFTTFEQYKKTDIYSTALVIWQLLRRTETETDKADSYQLPYFDHLKNVREPGVGTMQQLVCKERKRPNLSSRWSSNSVTKGICEMMELAWDANPTVRPSASLMNQTCFNLILKNEDKEDFRGITRGEWLSLDNTP